MLPSLPSDNTANGAVPDSIPASYMSLGKSEPGLLTNCQHHNVGQFVAGTFLSTLALIPTFTNHVSDVVLIRAQKEVGWIGAGTVVAPVENPQPLWYQPVVEFPRQPMNQNHLLLAAKPHVGVSVGGDESVPSPARSYLRTVRLDWPVLGHVPPEADIKRRNAALLWRRLSLHRSPPSVSALGRSHVAGALFYSTPSHQNTGGDLLVGRVD